MSCGAFAGKYECEPPPFLTNRKQPPLPERLHYKVLTVQSITDMDLRLKGRTAPMYGQSCANSQQRFYQLINVSKWIDSYSKWLIVSILKMILLYTLGVLERIGCTLRQL